MDDRMVDLLAENIDAGLRLGVLSDSALPARKLAQSDRLVVCSPAYLARRGVPTTPTDLVEHDAIVYGQSVGGQEWIFRHGSSEISVNLNARLMLSAAEGVREAVLSGQGFAISSRWMFAPEIASGAVVSVLQEWSLPPMDLWVIYPSGRLSTAKARAFVQWFEQIIGRAT
jgi:DNA-binding transcriptional LysR family regulator